MDKEHTLYNKDTNEGWAKWAEMVSSAITALDNDIKDIQNELKEAIVHINEELGKDQCDINNIKIALEELKRLSDNIINLRDAIKELKPMIPEVMALKTLSGSLKEERDDIKKIIADVAGLKVKASAWGAVGGILAGIGTILISLLLRK